jgi:hypothetical protein
VAQPPKPYYTYEVYEKSHSINREYRGGYTRNNVLHRKNSRRTARWSKTNIFLKTTR